MVNEDFFGKYWPIWWRKTRNIDDWFNGWNDKTNGENKVETSEMQYIKMIGIKFDFETVELMMNTYYCDL